MARGKVVADGPSTEIKARIGTRTIRVTLPTVDPANLMGLPGVTAAERHGEAVVLGCSDSDAALRALLARHADARDIEVTGAGLEQAFLELAGVSMTTLAYARTELQRTFRSKRFLVMALGFPLVLYFLIAVPNRGITDLGGTGVSAPRTTWSVWPASAPWQRSSPVAPASPGSARSAGAARSASPRSRRPRTYAPKRSPPMQWRCSRWRSCSWPGRCSAYVSPAEDWIRMTWLMLVALIPFAALGVLLGHLLTTDSIGPVVGGLTAVLAFLGGTSYPLGKGVLADIAQALPSYWLVQASHAALGGPGWPAKGWIVLAGWSLALILMARWAYRRDTRRV